MLIVGHFFYSFQSTLSLNIVLFIQICLRTLLSRFVKSRIKLLNTILDFVELSGRLLVNLTMLIPFTEFFFQFLKLSLLLIFTLVSLAMLFVLIQIFQVECVFHLLGQKLQFEVVVYRIWLLTKHVGDSLLFILDMLDHCKLKLILRIDGTRVFNEPGCLIFVFRSFLIFTGILCAVASIRIAIFFARFHKVDLILLINLYFDRFLYAGVFVNNSIYSVFRFVLDIVYHLSLVFERRSCRASTFHLRHILGLTNTVRGSSKFGSKTHTGLKFENVIVFG